MLNAVIGLTLFEWAWRNTSRVRNPNKELNKIYFMFERADAKYWARWKFYPGAVSILLSRLILLFLCFVLETITVRIVLIGHDRNKAVSGCRNIFLRFSKRCFVFMISTILFTTISYSELQVSYENWLGSEVDQIV